MNYIMFARIIYCCLEIEFLERNVARDAEKCIDVKSLGKLLLLCFAEFLFNTILSITEINYYYFKNKLYELFSYKFFLQTHLFTKSNIYEK